MIRSFQRNSFDDQYVITIATIAMNSGKRPSELFEWNDEDEWDKRLLFDMMVYMRYYEVMEHGSE